MHYRRTAANQDAILARRYLYRPLSWWGWGSIPDQYGRDWNGDDGDTPAPPAPHGLTDLPPILPWWGPQPWRARTAPPDPVEDGIRYRDLIT
jgi:hypothetical protein